MHMKVGFSFSPGGLLLPYHTGVLEALQTAGHLEATTPIAGSSAGAIAVACHAAGLSSAAVLDATIAVAEDCAAQGGAQGRLIPALRRQMTRLLGPAELERLTSRPGTVGIAYTEVWPRFNQPILQTTFTSLDDVMDAVCFSSTFPFFSDRWPVALDRREGRAPRIVVDGFFTVPRDRFGCPDLTQHHRDQYHHTVRQDSPEPPPFTEVLVSCLPPREVGLTAVPDHCCIGPAADALGGTGGGGMAEFLKLATQCAPPDTYFRLYEQGLSDGEDWSRQHTADLAAQALN
jgi:hypothetical protein